MKTILYFCLVAILAVPVWSLEIVRQKNVATIITFPLLDDNNDLVSATGNPDSEIDAWADGSAPNGFVDLTNEATEIGATGQYYISLTATEMNNDYIIIQIKSDNANTQTLLINTTGIKIGNFAHGGTSASFAFGAGGSISSASGAALTLSSSGGNGQGLLITGNGTGAGMRVVGGITADGVEFVGQGTGNKDIDADELASETIVAAYAAANGTNRAFRLTSGSSVNDAYKGNTVVITDLTDSTMYSRKIVKYLGANKMCVLDAPLPITVAQNDIVVVKSSYEEEQQAGRY